MLKYGLASVRKNPLAKRTTLKTLQHVTTKWLNEARDRDGGHKRCLEAAAARRQPGMNDDKLDWLTLIRSNTRLQCKEHKTYHDSKMAAKVCICELMFFTNKFGVSPKSIKIEFDLWVAAVPAIFMTLKKSSLKLKVYRSQKLQLLLPADKEKWLNACKRLKKTTTKRKISRMCFSAEKVFTVDFFILHYCLPFLFLGRRVFLNENRRNRSFILEYAGELLSAVEGGRREQATDDCSVYRYFFHYDHKEYWLVRCLLTEITSLTDKENYVLWPAYKSPL